MPAPPTPLPTEAREQLVTWLETTSWRVESLIPPVPTPPMLAVTADTPWLDPERLPSLAAAVNLKVLAVARDNREGQEQLEQMIHDVLDALHGRTEWRSVTAPQVLDLGAQGTVLVSEVSVTIHVKE